MKCKICESPNCEELIYTQDVYKCEVCGCLFRGSSVDLNKYFSSNYWFVGDDELKLHQRSKFEWFSDYVLDGHTIEFGASDGDMTILIRRAIPSSYWVYYSELKDMLRPEYGFRDIDKFIAPIEEAFSVPRFSGRFSNVFLIDVIEHLNDVVGALQGIWSILEEGGRLFIATNNGDSFRAPEAMFHHWEHTCVLTRVAVESFCRVGFVICRYFRDTADRLYVILEKRRLL